MTGILGSCRSADWWMRLAHSAGRPEAVGRLFISVATVKTHLLHIYAKLDVRDRASAVAEAYRRGLLS